MAEKKCNGCADRIPANVPYVVHESAMARAERNIKRLWILIIILILLLVGTNIAWLVYESSFETVEESEEITVEAGENGIANYIGNDGDIYNGEDYSQKDKENP